MPFLRQLQEGTRFLQPELNITGTLLRINECRAHVQIDGGKTDVKINDKVQFTAVKTKTADWTPEVWVTVLTDDQAEQIIQTKKEKATAMATATQSNQKITKKTVGPKTEDDKTAKKASPKKDVKAAKKDVKKSTKKNTAPKEQSPCKCGCGEMTGSNFKQGHDARFHGRCKKLKDGRLTMPELKKDKTISSYAYKFYERGHID